MQSKGFQVIRVTNILQRATKQPLPMFFIDLKTSPKNDEIFQITRFLNTIVTVEEPNKDSRMKQCKRCQLYGHTANYCNLPLRCVKCAGKHDTKMCTKNPSEPAKCALCDEDHPASYRGCSVYKQQAQFYNKTRTSLPRMQINNYDHSNEDYPNSQTNANRHQYSDVLKSNKANYQESSSRSGIETNHRTGNSNCNMNNNSNNKYTINSTNDINNGHSNNNDISQLLNTFLNEFKSVINPLISLLTKVIEKILP